MSDHAFGLVELLLVFGIVIALAVWDGIATRRATRDAARPPEAANDDEPPRE